MSLGESTGSYWKPVFNVLETAVCVVLANPEDVKARRGHKTDPKDSWWLAHLQRHAMIRPSFIPPPAIRDLRDLTRRRKQLLQDGTRERNRIQKVLEDANVKLGNVLTDISGASGQLMLDALLEGKAAPEEIVQIARQLEYDYASAARSLREGMKEMLPLAAEDSHQLAQVPRDDEPDRKPA